MRVARLSQDRSSQNAAATAIGSGTIGKQLYDHHEDELCSSGCQFVVVGAVSVGGCFFISGRLLFVVPHAVHFLCLSLQVSLGVSALDFFCHF